MSDRLGMSRSEHRVLAKLGSGQENFETVGASSTLRSMVTRAGSSQVLANADDATLLAAVARGDRFAIAQLYDRHVGPVYRYALSQLASVEDAEDVTQDVFITAWRRAGSIHLVDQSALPWLLVTTKHTCANRRRSTARNRHSGRDELADRPDVRFSPEAAAERRQLHDALGSAVAKLSAQDQRLFELCIERGVTYEAAAAELGATHGAVRNRLSRLRSTLRSRLDSYV